MHQPVLVDPHIDEGAERGDVRMGVYPNSFLRPIQVSVDHLVQQVNAATQAAGLQRASLY